LFFIIEISCRAVYSKADIYLLDDPLSAVDVRVARHLMDHCISGCLKNKCVILVTHQSKFLKNADQVLELKNGSIETRGSFSEILGVYLDDPENDSEMLAIDEIDLGIADNDPNLSPNEENTRCLIRYKIVVILDL